MKDTFKRLTTLGFLIIGTLLILTNCEQETLNSQEPDTSAFAENGMNKIIKTGNFNDFKELKSFVKRIKEDRDNEINRTSIEENNDFTILEDREIYIYTDSTSTTYTIAIQKETQNSYGFSNLVVNFFDDDPTTAFILNYIPSQDYLNTYVTDNQTPFQGTINYESINYDGSLDDLNARQICKSITLTYCDYDGETHAAGENCTPEYMFDITYDICYESTDNNPLNESIDPPSGPNSSGGNTPKTNPTNPLPSETCEDAITGEIGLTDINGECHSGEVFKLKEDLDNIVGENNYSFDDTLTDNEVISFDTIDEFEGFYSSIFDDVSTESSETENSDGESETKTFTHDFLLGIFSYSIIVEVDADLPSANSCECMEINNVTTILVGNTTLVEWEQVGTHNTEISNDGNTLTVTTRGRMTIGIQINGYPFNMTKLVTFVQVFEHSTGDVVNYYMISQ